MRQDYRSNPPKITDDSTAHPWGPLNRYYRETLTNHIGMFHAYAGHGSTITINPLTVKEI